MLKKKGVLHYVDKSCPTCSKIHYKGNLLYKLHFYALLVKKKFRPVIYLQDEFERRRRASEAWDGSDGTALTPEQEEERAAAKRKMVGNLRFIGELGKLEIIHESILHRCIQQVVMHCTGAFISHFNNFRAQPIHILIHLSI